MVFFVEYDFFELIPRLVFILFYLLFFLSSCFFIMRKNLASILEQYSLIADEYLLGTYSLLFCFGTIYRCEISLLTFTLSCSGIVRVWGLLLSWWPFTWNTFKDRGKNSSNFITASRSVVLCFSSK